MLPECVETLIFAYLDSINAYSDLPSLEAVQKLIKRTNAWVMNILGYVLGMRLDDLIRMRYRILLDHDFVFYFRLGALQRLRLIRLLKRGTATNVHVANLIWIFCIKTPPLRIYPEYNALFRSCLLCRVLSNLEMNSNAITLL